MTCCFSFISETCLRCDLRDEERENPQKDCTTVDSRAVLPVKRYADLLYRLAPGRNCICYA